jgi:hypothetical protein
MPKQEPTQCPLQDPFRFISKCPIEKCLYFTNRCVTKCIILDTSVPDVSTYGSLSKQFSVAEILYYKGETIPKATLRSLNSLKKGGALRLRGIVILYYYSEWVAQTHRDEISRLNEILQGSDFKTSLIKDVLDQYPLNIPDLNINLGILFFLVQRKEYKEFKRVSKVPVDIELADLFDLSQIVLNQVRATLKAQINKTLNLGGTLNGPVPKKDSERPR